MTDLPALPRLAPTNLNEAKLIAADFAKSGMFGSSRDPLTPEKAFVKLLRGNDLGVSVAEDGEPIHVIEGKKRHRVTLVIRPDGAHQQPKRIFAAQIELQGMHDGWRECVGPPFDLRAGARKVDEPKAVALSSTDDGADFHVQRDPRVAAAVTGSIGFGTCELHGADQCTCAWEQSSLLVRQI